MSLYGEFPNLYMGDTAMANIMVDGKPVRKLSFWELLKKVGPGIILTGVVIGPGNITISAMLGQLWLQHDLVNIADYFYGNRIYDDGI